MRRRRLLPTPTTTPSTAVAPPPVPGGYDWSRFGRHRLRAPASVVIDVPVPTVSHVYVSSVWPDARAPGGWARLPWEVDPLTGRGWLLPQQLAAGDIIEFAATTAGGWQRWHGVLDSYEFDRWLTVQGPYPDAAAAQDDAQRLLGLERFLPALDAQPRAADATPCTRHSRPRCRPHR
jgi:hypothetical protein